MNTLSWLDVPTINVALDCDRGADPRWHGDGSGLLDRTTSRTAGTYHRPHEDMRDLVDMFDESVRQAAIQNNYTFVPPRTDQPISAFFEKVVTLCCVAFCPQCFV